MKTGDRVEVTNLDGETAEGEIVTIMAVTASEHRIQVGDRDNHIRLAEYWRGQCDPDAPVIQVALSGGVYDYPADRVRVLNDVD